MSANRKIALMAGMAALTLGAADTARAAAGAGPDAVAGPGAGAGTTAADGAAGEDAGDGAGAIVVTGAAASAPRVGLSRLPADPHDIAQSVTVIDRTLLAAQGASSLAEALRNVPGITLGAAEGGQIGNNINLNGFTARTDLFLDGFRDRGQYYRDTFALESVEVLMGPSSMLFGRGSTGGAINQVPHRPALKPVVELAASATTNGLVRGTVGVNQPLSAGAALRIDAMAQTGAPTTRTAMTVHDYGFAPALRLGIGGPTEVTLAGQIQHNNDRPDYGLPPLNGAPARGGRDKVYGYSSDRTVQDITTGSLGLRHAVSPHVTLRNQVQYNAVTTDAIETAANTIGTIGAGGFAALVPAATSGSPPSALAVRLQSHDRHIRDTSLFDQAEVKADARTGAIRHDLLIGAEIGRDTYRNQNYYRNGTCNGVALNAVGATTGYVGCERLTTPTYGASPAAVPETPGNYATGRADTLGLYANETATIGPVKLVGGVRWDAYSATVTNSLNSGNTKGNTTLGYARQTVHYLSVRGGAIWAPTRMLSAYASYSTSFDPALEQLTSTTGISAPLPPAVNHAIEGGAKWDVARGRLHLSAAGFQITQDNARSQNADNTYSATGTVRVRGARAGAQGEIAEGWAVFAGYTHLAARIVNAIAAGTAGKVPLNTPRDAATLWTTWQATPAWQIGGGATYTGPRFANNTDTVRVPGAVRTDATVAWHGGGTEVRLNLFNLANARTYDALIASDGGRAVPGTGRTAMLSLVWRR